MKVVSYLRVSTARQGASGLGIEAQRAALAAFVTSGNHTIIAEHVEIESGSKNQRPELMAALAACKLHRATLVIAKLDRLARNVAFIANLMDGGVEFVACDMPQANKLTLHLLAAIAEHEREMISQRTKAALQAAKQRGVQLGNPQGSKAFAGSAKIAATKSDMVRTNQSDQFAASVASSIRELKAAGINCAGAIAVALNKQAIPTPSGGMWYEAQVYRLLKSNYLVDVT